MQVDLSPAAEQFVRDVVQNNVREAIRQLTSVVQKSVVGQLPTKTDGSFTKADIEAAVKNALDGAIIEAK